MIDHNYLKLTNYPFKDPIESKNTTIGNDVWIGCNSIILPGVNIGNGVVIGAGSIVTKDIPDYAIAVGNPAKVVKYRFDENTINEITKSKWWDWNINEIKNNYNLEFIKNER